MAENDPIAALEKQRQEITDRIAQLEAAKQFGESVKTDAEKAAEAARAKQVAAWNRNLTPGQAKFAESLKMPG